MSATQHEKSLQEFAGAVEALNRVVKSVSAGHTTYQVVKSVTASPQELFEIREALDRTYKAIAAERAEAGDVTTAMVALRQNPRRPADRE